MRSISFPIFHRIQDHYGTSCYAQTPTRSHLNGDIQREFTRLYINGSPFPQLIKCSLQSNSSFIKSNVRGYRCVQHKRRSCLADASKIIQKLVFPRHPRPSWLPRNGRVTSASFTISARWACYSTGRLPSRVVLASRQSNSMPGKFIGI